MIASGWNHLVHFRPAGIGHVDDMDPGRTQTGNDEKPPHVLRDRRDNCCRRSSRSDAARRRAAGIGTRWIDLRVGRRLRIDVDDRQKIGLLAAGRNIGRRDERDLLRLGPHGVAGDA